MAPRLRAPAELRIDAPANGATNMARDLALLEQTVADGRARVRIYTFQPACLSLGRLQDEALVDRGACDRDSVDVVRRPTGGRALLHGAEATYAVACREDDPDLGGDVLAACAAIHAVVARAIAAVGIATTPRARATDERVEARERALVGDCFARPASHELLDPAGLKLVGSAQLRRGPALLQHGSVLLEPPGAWRYLREKPATAATPGLRGLLGREVPVTELQRALLMGFAAQLGDRLAE